MHKKFNVVFLAALFINTTLYAKLNKFGISTLVPTKSNDNKIFDKRINEEMLVGQQLLLQGRHAKNIRLQHILDFIPKINAFFEHLLNTQSMNSKNLQLLQLALVDVQKAKKMLRPQDVSADDEQDLRTALWAITSKIDGYAHTDNVESSSYLPKIKRGKK